MVKAKPVVTATTMNGLAPGCVAMIRPRTAASATPAISVARSIVVND